MIICPVQGAGIRRPDANCYAMVRFEADLSPPPNLSGLSTLSLQNSPTLVYSEGYRIGKKISNSNTTGEIRFTPGFTRPLTVQIYGKVRSSSPSGLCYIFIFGSEASERVAILTNTSMQLGFNNYGDGTNSFITGATLTLGQQLHLALTINASGTITAYFDGVSVGSRGTTGEGNVNYCSVIIAPQYEVFEYIDEITIHNRILTPAEFSVTRRK